MAAEPGGGPAARVLAAAERRNAELGHENLGPLSESHGFLSRRVPEHDLPAPYDAWVAAADELPELCRKLRVRPRLDGLPLLDAAADALADRHLLRAAGVLGLLAHAYNNVPMRPPPRLPDAIVRPWRQTAERLGRPGFTLTNTDYIFDNWRLIDPDAADPMRLENLRLLNPVWDHPQMDTFVLVLVELLAQSAPLVGSAVRAQEACIRRDDESLKAELRLMGDTVRRLTRESLPKISANARAGPRRVDPVLWTKLFAMIPLPVQGAGEEVRNASGAETPYFHLMDVVLGRRLYDTGLGHEAIRFRETHPPHWREFLLAVGQEPIADYARHHADSEVSGLFAELTDAYQGRHGLLARHRLKAFAYMEAAFKTGRSSTVTGFTGLFEDRAWEEVDASFEAARLERERSGRVAPRLARVEHVDEPRPGVRRVALDVRGLGIHCQPGARCAVLPENEPVLVARTLEALRAGGDERVELTPEWVDTLAQRGNEAPGGHAALRDLARLGHVRPLTRAVAERLHAITGDAALRAILDARQEERWELWDLLGLLAASGFAPERLWRPGSEAAVCQVLPPLEPRSYSVSSVDTVGGEVDQIQLTVQHLSYEEPGPPARERRGTASTYLCHAVRPGTEIPVSIVHSPGFSPPADSSVPIVMLAEGMGVAPFAAFLQARARTPGTRNLLLAGAPRADALPHRELLVRHAERGEAEVAFAFAADGRRVEDLLREPIMRLRLPALMCPRSRGGAGARLYVCGRAAFARGVMEAVADVLDEPGRPGAEQVSELVVQRRYVQETLPAHGPRAAAAEIDASELARHTTASAGIWAAIEGRVYDLTWFAQMHPGGHKIIGSFAGMDATASYRIVEHHRDPAIHAQLPAFEIGAIRRLDLGPLDDLYRRWVRSLYALVEVQNAHRLDTSIRTEPLRRGETAPELTPYRLQFEVEAHRRFVGQTVAIVCRRFARLWEATPGADASPALGDRLDAIVSGAAGEAARERAEELERRLEADGATEALGLRLADLAAADAEYLETAKGLVATGVGAFEVYEAGVLSEGPDRLLDPLSALPGVTEQLLITANVPDTLP